MEREATPTRQWNVSETHIPPLRENCCQCSSCRDISERTKSLTNMQEFGPAIDLCVGDRVMVDGYLPGVVKYVGDLDSNYTNSPTYVGVKLDDPVGDSDGIANGKRYFSCNRPQAVFVEMDRVTLTVPIKFRPWGRVNNKRNSSLYRTNSYINSPSLLTATAYKTHRASLPSTINKKESLTCQNFNYSSSSMADEFQKPPTRQKSLPTKPTEDNTYNNGFTSRLLSTLPDDDIVLPDLPVKTFTDVNQFAEWMDTWGGGIRGWTMASTLQKLKDAQRKGKEETNWKKTISQLEKNGGYDTQIRKIKRLQSEIRNTQANTLAAEEEYTRLAYNDYKSQKEVGQISDQMYRESLKCQELEAAIKDTIQGN